MSRAQEITRAWAKNWINGARHSFAAALALGLSLSPATLAIGQQAPVWSPQPYSKPTSSQPAANSAVTNNAIPHNSLRTGATAEPATTLRWSKVEGSSATQSSSYAEAMRSDKATFQNAESEIETTPRISRSKVIKHNHLANQTTNQTTNQTALPASPSSGWSTESQNVVTASAQQPVQNSRPRDLVELASHESATVSPERMKSWPRQQANVQDFKLVPATGSTRRDWKQVKPASYQDDSTTLDLPKPPAGLPGIESPSTDLPPVDTPRLEQSPAAIEQVPPSLVLPPADIRGNTEKSPSDMAQPSDRGFEAVPRMTPQSSRSQRVSVDCESLQKSIEASDIRSISVDSSPKFVEGYKGSRVTSSKDEFVRTAPMRDWFGNDGEKITFGKLVDYARGQVFIENPEGEQVSYLFNRLSSVDLAYVADAWGLPVVCALGDGTLEPRRFTETTMTFKASGSCHKPLYFEEPQLERYGHEWGPVVQPVISTANFVKNAAFLPYKMGIHPMNECQYPLGYYRPGECAPWTVGPVPISLRGALMQAGAVTGAAAILP
jgi:hypothetical protein